MRLSTSQLLASFVSAAAVAYSAELPSSSICSILSIYLPDDVFYPETDTYNATVESYPFPQLRLEPTCIVRPKSAQDVATAVSVLRADGGAKFAVKGGGHNANAGFNNIEDGVTIDMQSLKDIDLSGDVVSVGAGALSQDVYDALDPFNKTALVGRIGVVGVAGFITGGGVSFLSPQKGWACDQVINFEIVLASGEIVDANATSRPDLYAALKGGQNNFGIVTRFDLKTYDQGPIWGGRIAYAPEADQDIVSALTDFKNPDNFDPYAAGWITFRYNYTTNEVTPIVIMWYTKLDQKPGTMKKFTDVQPQAQNGVLEGTSGEFTKNASVKVADSSQTRTIWATTSVRVSDTIIHKIYDTWKSLIPKVCETYAYASTASELTFQSIPPAPGNESDPNSLGIDPDSEPEKDLVFVQILFYFVDVGATKGLQNTLKDFITLFDDLAKGEGVYDPYIYLNFGAPFQDPLAGYGEENVAALKAVSKTYDPSGVFQKQLVGGFKLFPGNSTS